MEAKDIFTLIVGLVTLVMVTIQFFIKRKDEKSNYILNKKYELYTDFIKKFD